MKLTGKSGDMIVNSSFWKGKRVLVTGHTGFKGSWLSLMLHNLGAGVFGYALDPPTNPGMFNELRIYELITSYIGDIGNLSKLRNAVVFSVGSYFTWQLNPWSGIYKDR